MLSQHTIATVCVRYWLFMKLRNIMCTENYKHKGNIDFAINNLE